MCKSCAFSKQKFGSWFLSHIKAMYMGPKQIMLKTCTQSYRNLKILSVNIVIGKLRVLLFSLESVWLKFKGFEKYNVF